MKCLHIYGKTEQELADNARKILLLVEQGYKSGLNPIWDIEEDVEVE